MLGATGRITGLTSSSAKLLVSGFLRTKYLRQTSVQIVRGKKDINLSSLFTPIPVKPNPDDIDAGAEIAGRFDKTDLIKVLNKFYQKEEMRSLAADNGIDQFILHQAYTSFRNYCLESEILPADLHVVISDILQGAGHHLDIFPYFLRHAKEIFPHLECMDDLKHISDLRDPASWYPDARSMIRKIIFHSGPTNSGKTYHALERFISAKSGLYCGPLKLLAVEVFKKANQRGTPCNLVTGEEKQEVLVNGQKANHVSCTVEMSCLSQKYEVAVIDEIQMIKDQQRGWAWTRALLGLPAEEIHLCGEEAAVELIQNLVLSTGESVEVRRYKRLTELSIEKKPLKTLEAVQDGDCIVCFNKQDIYNVSRTLKKQGREVGVIYGSLPPNAKINQCAKFNNPEDPCKVLVATDAIGMGLNLSIRRIVFYSLFKTNTNDKGEKEIDLISVSQALQIAGRAGRYGTHYDKGFVTTFKEDDLPVLQNILSKTPENITKAGLYPTADQIELYAYHLPNSTFSNLLDIFVNLSTLNDSLYFICDIKAFKTLAEITQHVPLALRARYVFCCAPIDTKNPFISNMFLKFARRFSQNQIISFHWLCKNIGWPVKSPQNLTELIHCESTFDVLDLYLWMSYRFPDHFPHADLVREIQHELDLIIMQGVLNIVDLLNNSLSASNLMDGDDSDEVTGHLLRNRFTKGKRFLQLRGGERGKLSERLVAQGMLTPAMLKELQEEWKSQQENESSSKKPSTNIKTKVKELIAEVDNVPYSDDDEPDDVNNLLLKSKDFKFEKDNYFYSNGKKEKDD